jgi:type II secretion system protein N
VINLKVVRTLCGIGGAILLFPLLIVLFVPVGEIKGVLVRGLEQKGYVLRAQEFRKSLPFGLSARNVLIADERGPLMKLDEASARIRFFPLFIGRLSFDFQAKIRGGEVQAGYQPRNGSFSIHGTSVRLEDIPYFPTATGANVKGGLFVDGSFKGKGSQMRGALKVDVRGAELSAIKIGEMPLPDASYSSIRGMFRVAGGKGTLESLTFQGDGIYSRLSGTVPVSGPLASAPLDLTLELMPKPDFLERQKFVFLLLAKYQSSPGSYRIPVKGVLLKPAIQ